MKGALLSWPDALCMKVSGPCGGQDPTLSWNSGQTRYGTRGLERVLTPGAPHTVARSTANSPWEGGAGTPCHTSDSARRTRNLGHALGKASPGGQGPLACAAMRPSNVVLLALLLGTTACGHSARIPSLPASHGHLSRAMGHYLDPMAERQEAFLGGVGPLYDPAPTVVVEPAQARAIFAEAVQVLSGTATEEQVKQASQDLSAACDAELEEACTYQREQYQHPTKLEGKPPEMTRAAVNKRAMAVAIVSCRLGTDGIVRDIQVVEAAPYGLTEALITTLRESKYQPAMLAGHPIEIPYTFQLNTTFSRVAPNSQQELEWARTRAQRFPSSPSAWAHLARVLARDLPDDPWYPNALRYLNLTSPTYWWAAAELAWLHAKAGRYAEAEPLARMARKTGSQNPYVLETAALVAFHQGQCKQAVLDQQRAIAKLPAEWPQEEQARFKSALAEYQRQCPSDAPAPATPQTPVAQEPAPQQDTSTQGS